MKRWLPLILTAGFGLWFVSTLLPHADAGFNFSDLARTPIVFNGRHQPLDSFARNSLVQIRERHEHYDAGEKRTMPAIEWLAEVMFKPEQARKRQVFRIDNQELKQTLKLAGRDLDRGENRKYYAWSEIATEDNIPRLEAASEKAGAKKDASQRDAYEHAVLKLANALRLYNTLENVARPGGSGDFMAEIEAFRRLLPPEMNAIQAIRAKYPDDSKVDPAGSDPLLKGALRLVNEADERTDEEGNRVGRLPFILPPDGGSPWARMPDRLLGLRGADPLPEAMTAWVRLGDAYAKGDVPTFNETLRNHLRWCADRIPADISKANREVLFNRAAPFYTAMVIYVAALLLALSHWFTFSEWTRAASLRLALLAFAIHLVGLIFRMVLEGRPPVTNLYSSAIFIGLGAIILGLVLERLWRNAVGLAVGSLIGFITLVIAHNLALEGDTMEMLVAVLDTNFWLATHVVIVTLGYASTFVAGTLAVMYVIRGVFTRNLDAPLRQALSRMVYGIVCFATLFSFTGTVLGGIWADQSWGRFWGWDPKENGALIIVLWNALILHARWGGMVRERGVMVLAVAGNIVTAWSWFGVNMLGVGLHSYGFTSGAFQALSLFVGTQVFLILAASLPTRYWRSFQASPPAPSPAPGTAQPLRPRMA